MSRKALRASRLLIMSGLMVAVGLVLLLSLPGGAVAFSSYLSLALTPYPNIRGTALDDCTLCHPGGNTKLLNGYGTDYAAAGHQYPPIESMDSDGDGFTNIVEIRALTNPGDGNSKPGPTATPTRTPVPPSPTATRPGPTATATRTAVPTQVVTPAPTPTSAPLTRRAVFVGSVSSLPGAQNRVGTWRISGRTVRVTTYTWLENLGAAGNGSQVWVYGARRSDGSVDATYLRVLTLGGGGGDD